MEAVAKLRNHPTSPRKMRLLADLIRGMEVEKALNILHFHPKHPSVPLEKLVLSAIDNWKQKNADDRVEDAGLYIKVIFVDGGRTLKRMRPAPQGRGYRIRKRSNHVTVIVDSRLSRVPEPVTQIPALPVIQAAPENEGKETTSAEIKLPAGEEQENFVTGEKGKSKEKGKRKGKKDQQ